MKPSADRRWGVPSNSANRWRALILGGLAGSQPLQKLRVGRFAMLIAEALGQRAATRKHWDFRP